MPPALRSITALIGNRRKTHRFKEGRPIYSQGDAADSVFYLRAGRVQLSVFSTRGKEAIIAVLEAGSFFGEKCLAGQLLRVSRATALTACTVLEVKSKTMTSLIRAEPQFSAQFMAHLLSHNIRIQQDLVDQLVSSSEKRLARLLLRLASFGKKSRRRTSTPAISQEKLAEMIGTSRSTVSRFMNKFRKRGFIEYNGYLKVNSSLLNILLDD